MKYCKVGSYKYTLMEDFVANIPIYGFDISIPNYVYLYTDGTLLIRKKYKWDGCSGPTVDDNTNMVAGLVHDALYQLIREGEMDASYRKIADELLRDICIKNGMCKLRAWIWYFAVRAFAGSSAKCDVIEC